MSKTNINTFLQLLDTNTKESTKVHIPSLNVEVECKLLTVPQQKEVIKATLNGVRGNMSLPKVFNSIILCNIQDGSNISIIDRNAILVQLRTCSLGTIIYSDNGEQTQLEYTTLVVPPLSTVIEDNGITVWLTAPDLKKDSEYYNLLEDRVYDNAGDIVNDLYVFEAAKFIEKIEFQGEEAIPSIRDSIKMVDKLPLSLNDKILKFIKTVKDFETKMMTARNGSQIALNARFFNTTE